MEDFKEREYVILRTYRSVWKVPKKIYSIDNIKLMFPINPEEMLYFLVSAVLTILLLKIIPFLDMLPAVIKYGIAPYGIMKFLTKQKLDGKLPHKFFIDYLIFIFSPKISERFEDIKEYDKVKFRTWIPFRDIDIINKTVEALKSNGNTKKKKGKEAELVNV